MDQCSRNSVMTAGAAGVLVLLGVWLLGGHPFVAALMIGAMVGILIGALLIWGLCSGRGTAAENEAVTAAMWEPEPFTPNRRVVAPGGRTVSTRPMSADAPEGIGAAPALSRVTLQPSRDPAASRPSDVPAPSVPEAEGLTAPATSVALPATPSIASVIPVAPLSAPIPVPNSVERDDAGVGHDDDDDDDLPPGALPDGGISPEQAAHARAEKAARKAAKAERKAAKAARRTGPPAQDVALGEDRVATLTAEDAPAAAPALTEGDALTRIDGIDQMTARWLHDAGVTSLAQIAAWDSADIARFAGMMGRGGHRIRQQDWAGQAARLIGQAPHG